MPFQEIIPLRRNAQPFLFGTNKAWNGKRPKIEISTTDSPNQTYDCYQAAREGGVPFTYTGQQAHSKSQKFSTCRKSYVIHCTHAVSHTFPLSQEFYSKNRSLDRWRNVGSKRASKRSKTGQRIGTEKASGINILSRLPDVGCPPFLLLVLCPGKMGVATLR